MRTRFLHVPAPLLLTTPALTEERETGRAAASRSCTPVRGGSIAHTLTLHQQRPDR